MYRLQVFCFFKQKTAYEMRISDWSSDVCSSDLLMATRQAADALGICFHVGSQAMSPQAYSDAIERVRAAIVDAAVTVDIIDVGGGFPSIYPGMEPVALENYFDAIHRGFESLPISYSAELWCEPGRALSAEYSSVVEIGRAPV